MFTSTVPDLRGLRAMKAIEESGSLADAAARLHLTPSALSHQLRELESTVGMTLLQRKTRPPEFTRAGKRLLTLAGLVTAAVKEAERDLGRLQSGSSGRLNMAIECRSCFEWLLPITGEFRAHWPDVEIDFADGVGANPQQALLGGEIDLLLTSDPRPTQGLARLRLFEYELLLLVPPAHALAARTFVAPTDLVGETLLSCPQEEGRQDLFREFLLPAGKRPAQVRLTERDPLMAQLVASGHGVAALPNWAANDYLTRGWVRGMRLGREGIWCTLYAVLREEDLQRAYIKDFIGTARDACLAQLPGVRPASTAG